MTAPPPPPADHDHDGIADVDDACPDDAETFNGRNDEDGCPDAYVCGLRVTQTCIGPVCW